MKFEFWHFPPRQQYNRKTVQNLVNSLKSLSLTIRPTSIRPSVVLRKLRSIFWRFVIVKNSCFASSSSGASSALLTQAVLRCAAPPAAPVAPEIRLVALQGVWLDRRNHATSRGKTPTEMQGTRECTIYTVWKCKKKSHTFFHLFLFIFPRNNFGVKIVTYLHIIKSLRESGLNK